MSDYAFMVTQVGEKGSAERTRADDVSDQIAAPVLRECGLDLRRADRDATPGQITPMILRSLIDSRVVLADLTGRNPNVYYELAIAHAFTKPVIGLIDDTKNVAFDMKDERLIVLGSYDGGFRFTQVEDAKTALRAALKIALADGYQASSLITDAASAQSLDNLAPENPVASELAALRESVEDVRLAVMQSRHFEVSRENNEDLSQAISLVEHLIAGGVNSRAFVSVDLASTSSGFDNWIDAVRAAVHQKEATRRAAVEEKDAARQAAKQRAASPPPIERPSTFDPWATDPANTASGWNSDDPPF